jgi:hypothetical protein
MKKVRQWNFGHLLLLLVTIVAFAGVFWTWFSCVPPDKRTEVASLECLFSGLAFAGLIVTLLQQQQEMRMQRQEMHSTAKSLMQASYLSVLGIYLEHLRARNESNADSVSGERKYLAHFFEAERVLTRLRDPAVDDILERRGRELHSALHSAMLLVDLSYNEMPKKEEYLLNQLEVCRDESGAMFDNRAVGDGERIDWLGLSIAIDKLLRALKQTTPREKTSEEFRRAFEVASEEINKVAERIGSKSRLRCDAQGLYFDNEATRSFRRKYTEDGQLLPDSPATTAPEPTYD